MAWTFERVAGPYQGRTGGLAWDGSGLLFSEVMEERVLRFDPETGKTTDFRRWTGRVNGLARAADGSVYGAQEGGRRVVRFLVDGSTEAVTEFLDGRRHNQPTDVALDAQGRAYIADAWNALAPFGPPTAPMLEHASVLRSDPIGPGRYRLSRVTHDTRGPRALALSPDGRTLYVADGDAERGDVCQLLAYPLSEHGTVGEPVALLAFTAADRGIEGLCVTREGDLIACAGWAKSGAGPMVYVIAPSGTILEAHPAPADLPMRCAFGDAGLTSLYLTAGDGSLYRCRDTGRRGPA